MGNTQRHPRAAAFGSELARLQCLHSLQVLDTPPDPTLDALAHAAAAALGCPAALVSLVDETRQWFKARVGLQAQETPREWAFCHHAVQAGHTLVVADARQDPRFADNPLVTGVPRIRFYAGVPLWVDGHAVGTLCVLDHSARTITPAQTQTLEQLTLAVQGVLERVRALKALALNEIRLRDFVHASSAFVWECDTQGRLLWASPDAADHVHSQVLQGSAGPAWNGPLRDPLGRLVQPVQQLQDLLSTPQRFVNRWVDLPGPDGPLTMALSAVPVTGAQGQWLGWRGKARNIAGEVQALRRANERDERLVGIAAHVPGLLLEFALTREGRTRLRYASQGLQDTFGLTPQAAQDELQTLFNRVHESDIGPLRNSIAASARTLQVWREEFRVQWPEGGTRWLEGHATPRRETDGEVRWFGFIHDITQRRAHEAQLADAQLHLRLAVQAARLGVVHVDDNGVVQLDAQAQRDHALVGGPPRLPLARWLAQVNPGDHERLRDALTLARSRPTAVRIVYALRTTGRWVTLELQRHDDRCQLVGICRDTSDSHLADKLRREHEQAAQRRQHEAAFISRASHELRTPMNAILGFVQLLSADQRAPLALHQQAWLGHVESAGQHLLQLIHDLLDLSKLNQTRPHPELHPTPLADAAQRCIQLLRGLADQAAVVLAAPQGALTVQAMAQEPLLQQLLGNVVGNAIKYNRPGGKVQITLHTQGEHVLLDVQDQGRGIAPEQIDRLFLPFERLGAEKGPVHGTGLGMALARHAAESMGGTLAVAWTSEQGTCLRLTLRAGASASGARGPAHGAHADANHMLGHDPNAGPDTGQATEPGTVPDSRPSGPKTAVTDTGHALWLEAVCVEDNPVNALLVECVFEQVGGWNLRTYDSAEAARDTLAQAAFHLLLMDLQLPGECGLAAVQRMVVAPGHGRPHCVAVTADASADTRALAVAAGFDSYLEKPLDLKALIALLDRVRRDQRDAAP